LVGANFQRRHFRPEIINLLDEFIFFEQLSLPQINAIVGLQLDQVRRSAHGQDIESPFSDGLVDRLAQVGYKPEYGAREPRRQIRRQVETKLAKAMLGGTLHADGAVTCDYDAGHYEVIFARQPLPAMEKAAADAELRGSHSVIDRTLEAGKADRVRMPKGVPPHGKMPRLSVYSPAAAARRGRPEVLRRTHPALAADVGAMRSPSASGVTAIESRSGTGFSMCLIAPDYNKLNG